MVPVVNQFQYSICALETNETGTPGHIQKILTVRKNVILTRTKTVRGFTASLVPVMNVLHSEGVGGWG